MNRPTRAPQALQLGRGDQGDLLLGFDLLGQLLGPGLGLRPQKRRSGREFAFRAEEGDLITGSGQLLGRRQSREIGADHQDLGKDGEGLRRSRRSPGLGGQGLGDGELNLGLGQILVQLAFRPRIQINPHLRRESGLGKLLEKRAVGAQRRTGGGHESGQIVFLDQPDQFGGSLVGIGMAGPEDGALGSFSGTRPLEFNRFRGLVALTQKKSYSGGHLSSPPGSLSFPERPARRGLPPRPRPGVLPPSRPKTSPPSPYPRERRG